MSDSDTHPQRRPAFVACRPWRPPSGPPLTRRQKFLPEIFWWVAGLTIALAVLPITAPADSTGQTANGADPRLASLDGFRASAEHTPRRPRPQPAREPRRDSWSVAFDNDMLVPGSRDQDYTYGLSASYTGAGARDFWFSLDTPLRWLDRLAGLAARSNDGVESHTVEAGLFGFTPEDVEATATHYDDRPYASLIYLSQSRVQVDRVNRVAWHSSLTVGALGLDLVGDAQNAVHKVTGSHHAEGWDDQISDGGEPTARYAIARQKYLDVSSDNLEVKSTLQGSLGYLTEASWSLSFRGGRLRSPWWQSNPELVSYGQGASQNNRPTGTNEHYLWGGAAIVARGYNAFLQGQFRDSEVRYQFDELNHLVLEAWVGYTFEFQNGYRLSYVLRGHTSEVRDGAGDRNLLWGGVIVAKTFD
tara:strand:- start:9541 stop:10791 length:1251 start_codon:yes stop_codon:yes gene_type:complete